MTRRCYALSLVVAYPVQDDCHRFNVCSGGAVDTAAAATAAAVRSLGWTRTVVVNGITRQLQCTDCRVVRKLLCRRDTIRTFHWHCDAVYACKSAGRGRAQLVARRRLCQRVVQWLHRRAIQRRRGCSRGSSSSGGSSSSSIAAEIAVSTPGVRA